MRAPQNGAGEVFLGPKVGAEGWRRGEQAGVWLPPQEPEQAPLSSDSTESLVSSPVSNLPCKSLSRWLPVSRPSMEGLPEPTVRAPFPGVRGDRHGYCE